MTYIKNIKGSVGAMKKQLETLFLSGALLSAVCLYASPSSLDGDISEREELNVVKSSDEDSDDPDSWAGIDLVHQCLEEYSTYLFSEGKDLGEESDENKSSMPCYHDERLDKIELRHFKLWVGKLDQVYALRRKVMKSPQLCDPIIVGKFFKQLSKLEEHGYISEEALEHIFFDDTNFNGETVSVVVKALQNWRSLPRDVIQAVCDFFRAITRVDDIDENNLEKLLRSEIKGDGPIWLLLFANDIDALLGLRSLEEGWNDDFLSLQTTLHSGRVIKLGGAVQFSSDANDMAIAGTTPTVVAENVKLFNRIFMWDTNALNESRKK